MRSAEIMIIIVKSRRSTIKCIQKIILHTVVWWPVRFSIVRGGSQMVEPDIGVLVFTQSGIKKAILVSLRKNIPLSSRLLFDAVELGTQRITYVLSLG
jgi:hypothetical protein